MSKSAIAIIAAFAGIAALVALPAAAQSGPASTPKIALKCNVNKHGGGLGN